MEVIPEPEKRKHLKSNQKPTLKPNQRQILLLRNQPQPGYKTNTYTAKYSSKIHLDRNMVAVSYLCKSKRRSWHDFIQQRSRKWNFDKAQKIWLLTKLARMVDGNFPLRTNSISSTRTENIWVITPRPDTGVPQKKVKTMPGHRISPMATKAK